VVTGPGLMGVVEQRGCASILGRFRCLCTIDDRGNCGLFRVMRCGCKQFSKWREFVLSFIHIEHLYSVSTTTVSSVENAFLSAMKAFITN